MSYFVINLAPTGMVPTAEMTPHVPLAASRIVDDVLACAELGASMFHLHARDEHGLPTWRPEVYGEVIAGIRRQRDDLILTASTSGRHFGEFFQRAAVLDLPAEIRPDMASLTLGSLNFLRDASINSPDMILRLAEKMAEAGVKPELEVFDLGMVNIARMLIDRGLLRPPFYFNILVGNIASAQASLLHLGTLLADLPRPAVVVLAGIGRTQTAVAGIAAAMADGVRIGLEDNIWYDANRTRLASNRDLVQRACRMAAEQERSIARPADMRHRLGLSLP